MKTIGITGGIGSGKSFVSALLQEHFGIPVYDCDAEAKRLTATDEGIRRQLISLVGPQVFDGPVLNRQCLADYLFASAENALRVNAIIHPVVLEDFKRWMVSPIPSQGGVFGLESAIIFESGFNKSVDYVLFVDAPQEVRLQRAMKRDGASELQIRARMKMQSPEQYKEQADFIINNVTDDTKGLLQQLEKMVHKLVNN